MPTKLTRAVHRETSTPDPCFGRTICIELAEGGKLIHLRQKGRRTRYAVTYSDLWRFAVRLALDAQRKTRRTNTVNRGKL